MKRVIFVFLLLMGLSPVALAQGNAFSFQGRLNDGTSPANGAYDLEFKLFPSLQGGTQIAVASRPNTTLINGVFSVTLDFGATAFNNPDSIFIEIAVRPNGSPNAFTILGPRQQLTVVPFSVRAMNATNADNATNAQNALNATFATQSVNANQLGHLPADEYVTRTNGGADFIRNSTTTQPNSNFNISGNGFINGNLSLVGNTAQNRDKGGFVKGMVYVDQFGALVRCYNGITGSSTGDCGFTVTHPGVGDYLVDFHFQVNDRFLALSAGTGSSVTLVASFFQSPSNPNAVFVSTFITDVGHKFAATEDDFMLIIY